MEIGAWSNICVAISALSIILFGSLFTIAYIKKAAKFIRNTALIYLISSLISLGSEICYYMGNLRLYFALLAV